MPVRTWIVSLLPLVFAGASACAQAPAAPQPGPAPAHSQFHEPEAASFDDHTGFQSLFDGKSLADWEGDPAFWRVENGAIVGESSKDNPVSNTYIWRKGIETKNFDLRLEIKCEIAGGSGIQYRSQVGLPWDRPLRAGEKPRNLQWMMTGPQADFWFPVTAQAASYTGQWYSENTMQGILAYRGQATQALPGQTNRLIANIGDKQALGGYVKVNEWNDYEIIARGGVMMHIMNGQLMAVFIDDNKDSVNNQPGLIGFEIESQPCKISVRDIWLRRFD
jgi:hypothetical protein